MFNPLSIKKEATTIADAIHGNFTMHYEIKDAITSIFRKTVVVVVVVGAATVYAALLINKK